MKQGQGCVHNQGIKELNTEQVHTLGEQTNNRTEGEKGPEQ